MTHEIHKWQQLGSNQKVIDGYLSWLVIDYWWWSMSTQYDEFPHALHEQANKSMPV